MELQIIKGPLNDVSNLMSMEIQIYIQDPMATMATHLLQVEVEVVEDSMVVIHLELIWEMPMECIRHRLFFMRQLRKMSRRLEGIWNNRETFLSFLWLKTPLQRIEVINTDCLWFCIGLIVESFVELKIVVN